MRGEQGISDLGALVWELQQGNGRSVGVEAELRSEGQNTLVLTGGTKKVELEKGGWKHHSIFMAVLH